MSKSTIPEVFDDHTEEQTLTQEELLMSENEILRGLLNLGRTQDDAENYRQIKIERQGRLELAFRIRPLSEDETHLCLRQATRYAPAQPGRRKTALDMDVAKYHSYLIYTATVDKDRAKIWDNREAQDALDVLQGVDMIDTVLLAGEKLRVIDIINEISGYKRKVEELAKN